MTSLPFRLSDIIPSQEELTDMGRRRYQQPSILKTSGKRPMWYFRARVDAITSKGGQKGIERPEERFYVGYCDEMTKQEAKKQRDEILSSAINKPQVLITSQVLFSEVLAVYKRDHMAALRDTTRKTEESLIRLIEPTLGKLRMCDIDALAVQRWLSSLHHAYNTKKNYFARLKLIWHCAQDWGYTQQIFPRATYTFGVKRWVKGRSLPAMDQLRRMLAALEDPYRAMAEIELFTGLRISEVRGLKWADVGPNTLTVRKRLSAGGNFDTTKNSEERVFDIRPIAEVFARLPRKSEWIFNHPGNSYEVCRKRIKAAAKVAGTTVNRWGSHHLRAAFNTLARSSGADAVDRQALMGHADERMNAMYVMQAAEDVKRRGDLMLTVKDAVMGKGTKGVM